MLKQLNTEHRELFVNTEKQTEDAGKLLIKSVEKCNFASRCLFLRNYVNCLNCVQIFEQKHSNFFKWLFHIDTNQEFLYAGNAADKTTLNENPS